MWVVQVSSERQSARNGVHEFQYLDFFVIFALAADRSFQYRSFFVTGGQPADADTMSANEPECQSASSLTPAPPNFLCSNNQVYGSSSQVARETRGDKPPLLGLFQNLPALIFLRHALSLGFGVSAIINPSTHPNRQPGHSHAKTPAKRSVYELVGNVIRVLPHILIAPPRCSQQRRCHRRASRTAFLATNVYVCNRIWQSFDKPRDRHSVHRRNRSWIRGVINISETYKQNLSLAQCLTDILIVSFSAADDSIAFRGQIEHAWTHCSDSQYVYSVALHYTDSSESQTDLMASMAIANSGAEMAFANAAG